MKQLSGKILNFCKEVVLHFVKIDGSLKAAALAYATLVSTVPLMVLSLGFMLAFPAFSVSFEALHRFLFRQLMPSSAHAIQKYVELFASNATNLSATGLIFFLITAVLLIFAMETVMNSVWRVQARRKGIRAFLLYWAILTLIPPLGVLGVGLSVFLHSLPYVSAVMEFVAFLAPLFLSFLALLFTYMAVPNCKVALNHAAVGAIIAAILFELTKMVFGIYATKFSSDAVVYGVLSAIPFLLLWLYLSWLIVIIGAIISYKLSPRAHVGEA